MHFRGSTASHYFFFDIVISYGFLRQIRAYFENAYNLDEYLFSGIVGKLVYRSIQTSLVQ